MAVLHRFASHAGCASTRCRVQFAEGPAAPPVDLADSVRQLLLVSLAVGLGHCCYVALALLDLALTAPVFRHLPVFPWCTAGVAWPGPALWSGRGRRPGGAVRRGRGGQSSSGGLHRAYRSEVVTIDGKGARRDTGVGISPHRNSKGCSVRCPRKFDSFGPPPPQPQRCSAQPDVHVKRPDPPPRLTKSDRVLLAGARVEPKKELETSGDSVAVQPPRTAPFQ